MESFCGGISKAEKTLCDGRGLGAPAPSWPPGAFLGVVFDNEHRGGYRWFLRARAHHFRGLFW